MTIPTIGKQWELIDPSTTYGCIKFVACRSVASIHFSSSQPKQNRKHLNGDSLMPSRMGIKQRSCFKRYTLLTPIIHGIDSTHGKYQWKSFGEVSKFLFLDLTCVIFLTYSYTILYVAGFEGHHTTPSTNEFLSSRIPSSWPNFPSPDALLRGSGYLVTGYM